MTFDLFRAVVPLAVLAAMCGSMRQQALAARQATHVVAVSPSDYPTMPPALRAQVLRELKREVALSRGAAARAFARDCYDALAKVAPARP